MMGIFSGIIKAIFSAISFPFKLLRFLFRGKKKDEPKKDVTGEIKQKQKEIKEAKSKLGRGFMFNEKSMKGKLEKLEASIRRHPEKLKYLEHLFKKYQAKIKNNWDRLRDKDDMNASVQTVIKTIRLVKENEARKAKNQQTEVLGK